MNTTGRNILTENYHTQKENADSIKLQIKLVSDILLGLLKHLFELICNITTSAMTLIIVLHFIMLFLLSTSRYTFEVSSDSSIDLL
jgi:hypothetical protein